MIALPLSASRSRQVAASVLVAAGLLAVAAFLAVSSLLVLLSGLLALLAAGLILRWPWVVWLLPTLTLPIASAMQVGPISWTEILLAGVLFIWLLAGAATGTLRLYHHPLLLPLLAYLYTLGLASLSAGDLREALKEMVKWVEFAGVLALVPVLVRGSTGRWVVAGLLLAAMGQALLGLYQFVSRSGPEWFVILDRYVRASGSFRQPNPFAGYLGVSLPIALALLLWSIGRVGQGTQRLADWAWTAFYAVAVAVVFTGLLASWSRGAWLGVVASSVTVLLLFNRRLAVGTGVALVGIALAALGGAVNPAWVPASILSRLQDLPTYVGLGGLLDQPVTDANFAAVERLAHWVAALRMFAQSPWFGVGPGNYAHAYAGVALPLWQDPLGHAHNIYLNVLAESGLVGFAAFGLLWGAAGLWVWRRCRAPVGGQSQSTRVRAIAVGTLGVLVHLAVHSLFDNLFVQGIYLQIGFWLALLAATAVDSDTSTNESEVHAC